MADNCSILEPWSVLSGVGAGGRWAPDLLARESEALTRALQVSLSHPDASTTANIVHHQRQQQESLTSYLSSSSMDLYSSPSSHLLPSPTTPSSAAPLFAKPEMLPVPVPTASDSDSPTAAAAPKRPRAAGVAAGRVSKRRPSRASKRNPTTFISADPAHFRQMVQEVTGVQIPVLGGGATGGCLSSASGILSRPEPLRIFDTFAQQLGAGAGGSSYLPTLDTSEFLLDGAVFDRAAAAAAAAPPSSSFPPASAPAAPVPFSSGGLDMGLPCFPTLESSWEVM